MQNLETLRDSRLGSLFLVLLWLACTTWGCSRKTTRTDLDYSFDVLQTFEVAELSEQELVQFESVFWEPDDSASLRELIVEDEIANGRRVLEIGTGTGLLSLLCLRYGATQVVATDINPAAAANARYNAAAFELDENLEVRLVKPESPGAFAVIDESERFDLIITNPPWEDGEISRPSDHAFYDPQFALMDSLLADLPKHLNPGGRCLLAYGHKPAITRLLAKAQEKGFKVKILDDRKLEDLEGDFLPGMLVELRLDRNQAGKVDAEAGAFTSPSK